MADAFNFELVSPEALLLSEDITEVVVPGEEGYFTVMANHAPTMSTLKPGVAEIKTAAGEENRYVVFGGFIDVTPTSCTLLAESAVSVADIKADDLEQRITNAQEDVNDAKDGVARAKAQGYLDQLTTLRGAILPA